MAKQQDVLNAFKAKVKNIVGTSLNNRIYLDRGIERGTTPDMPYAIFFVVDDQDENLLGNEVINNTNIQVTFFGKEDDGVVALRNISDTLVDEIDRSTLDNGMTVRVNIKGITIISDVNDQNVQIVTEFNVR